MPAQFEEDDLQIIKEMAQHEAEPGFVQKALQTIGKPIDKLMGYVQSADNKYIKKALQKIDSAIVEALRGTVKMANQLTSEDKVRKEYRKQFGIEVGDIRDIRQLPLKQMDRVADAYEVSNGVLVATEGAVLGIASTLAEGIPFAQLAIPAIVTADVTASMTLMSRHVCQIATSYGYSSYDPLNMPDILSAMAPVATSADEGFLILKAGAVYEIREAGKFAAKHAGALLDDVAAPQLIALIRAVAQRLGVVITEKELGLLVPIAGAALNGGLNLAFQQTNHTNAKDYFRRLILIDRYGREAVWSALEAERNLLMNKRLQ
ncbi:EcsC family protein [Paenibacillus athensensis]|nr:EcsC family protein [Paenibacillus athensensis]MCD1260700.1 EcsC family protein [Paenibacillus athensensis]